MAKVLAKLKLKGVNSWLVKAAIAALVAVVGDLVDAAVIPPEVAQTVLDVLRLVGQLVTGS